MGVLFSVLVVVGAAAMVLPRVLRRSSPEETPDPRTKGKGGAGEPGGKALSSPYATDSPSRRFAAVAQRVGSGGGVAPEPLRDANGHGGWQPEMGSGFHQTTAYPEPPARYEEAEEQTRSGSRPAVRAADQPGKGTVRGS